MEDEVAGWRDVRQRRHIESWRQASTQRARSSNPKPGPPPRPHQCTCLTNCAASFAPACQLKAAPNTAPKPNAKAAPSPVHGLDEQRRVFHAILLLAWTHVLCSRVEHAYTLTLHVLAVQRGGDASKEGGERVRRCCNEAERAWVLYNRVDAAQHEGGLTWKMGRRHAVAAAAMQGARVLCSGGEDAQAREGDEGMRAGCCGEQGGASEA